MGNLLFTVGSVVGRCIPDNGGYREWPTSRARTVSFQPRFVRMLELSQSADLFGF